jgi:hypothetical protein
MCFPGGDEDLGKDAREAEAARQARIRAGMAQISKLFDGGGMNLTAATSYDPSQSYFTADGTPWSPNIGDLGGGPFGFGGERRNDPDFLISQGKLFTGTRSGGFDDAFFAKRATDYSAFAMPEMNRQADTQHKNLIYALSRTGNLDSSAAIDKNAELVGEENKQRINIANAGVDQSNQLRSQVESTRGNVVAELNATGDDTAAGNSAMRSVKNLNQPAGFSPLGELFQAFANSVANIGSRASNGYAGFAGTAGAPAGGLFSTGSGSQRVVGA